MKDYGVMDYARYDGFCYTLVPIRTESRGGNVGYINHDALYPIFMGEEVEGSITKPLQFGNIAQKGVLCDYFTRYNISATRIREGFTRVASGFITEGSISVDAARNTTSYSERHSEVANAMECYTKAEALLNRGLEVLPNNQVGYTYENTYPYIHTYYTIAAARMILALDEYERAIALLNDVLAMQREPAMAYDDIEYMDNLHIAYNELLATAESRGINAQNSPLFELALKHGANGEELYMAYEEAFLRGDSVAAAFIAARGEWAKYYMQFCSIDSFSTSVNRELNFAMMDVIDALRDSSTIAGSYDWLANPTKEEALVENPLQFDSLVQNYVEAIDRVTPSSARDPKFALMEAHIFNLYSIYYYLDRSPQLGYDGPEALYHRDLVKYLNRREVRDVIESYAHEYGMEVLEVM
jgi:tetratricopeptide (TPR) repeat protein